MSVAVSGAANVQYAALPWRRVDGVVEVLLLTTRNTRSWIVPKGWPVKGRSPEECAALEALEEAGVLGQVAPERLGTFQYQKRRKSGEIVSCRVHVFALEVARQRRNWIEKDARELCWCSVKDAQSRVTNPGLKRLLGKFAEHFESAEDRRPRALRRIA